MDIKTLWALKNSNEAPFNHEEYTIWLHNKIIDDIQWELWNFREKESEKIQSQYALCNHIMTLPSLKKIKK